MKKKQTIKSSFFSLAARASIWNQTEMAKQEATRKNQSQTRLHSGSESVDEIETFQSNLHGHLMAHLIIVAGLMPVTRANVACLRLPLPRRAEK